MTSTASAEPVYAITLHQPWAPPIALGINTVETRSWGRRPGWWDRGRRPTNK